jgi:hypothetical protein
MKIKYTLYEIIYGHRKPLSNYVTNAIINKVTWLTDDEKKELKKRVFRK